MNVGIPQRRIYFIRLPMKKILNYYKSIIEQSKTFTELKLEKETYFLVATHKEENENNPENLTKIVIVLEELTRIIISWFIVSTSLRTRKRIEM